MVIDLNHERVSPLIDVMAKCLIDNDLKFYNTLKQTVVYLLTYTYHSLPNIMFGPMVDKEAEKRKLTLETENVVKVPEVTKNNTEEYVTSDSLGW